MTSLPSPNSPPLGSHHPPANRGAALIVALLLLLVLAVLGISAAQKSTMQEKMAGNTQNRTMAFQAAEYALARADLYLSDNDNLTNLATYCNCEAATPSQPAEEGVRCACNDNAHANTQEFWLDNDNFNWATSAKSVPINQATFTDGEHFADKLSGNPRYVIEILDEAGCVHPDHTANCYFYRVTARAQGGNRAAVVILQTMYERPTP